MNTTTKIPTGSLTTPGATTTNTLERPDHVVPQMQTVNADGNNLTFTIPAKTFAVCKSK